MAFTLSEIQQAHQQFTGVDFPKLFKAFKDMGMTYNIVNIQDGTVTYVHQSEDDIVTSSVKSNHPVAPSSNQSIVQDVLTRHQQGQTDFETFCNEMAEAGIYKWHIDIQAGTCTYIDLKEQAIISELIPQ
ncbi:phage envelope protein [Staphylococcus aureus]|nr:phage envelope protein [Staphylococcus aureus]CAC9106622.1 phage envelope protein [Staphylococcus aureus]